MTTANRLIAIVLTLLAILPRPLAAEQPRRVTLPGAFDRGDRIAVELRDGRRISGLVGSRVTAGFYVDERTESELFIKYRTVRALLDPDTGAVIGVPAAIAPDRAWIKPVVIVGAVIGILAIASHGMIPLCVFSRYYCLD